MSEDWAHIPLHILEGELRRRQDGAPKPECGSKGKTYDYDTPAHVFALFLILLLSTGGAPPSPALPRAGQS